MEVLFGDRASEQAGRQDIGGGNRILHREIYPDTADRRHRMRGIADAQQPRPVPDAQAIDRNAQQLDIGPIAQLVDAIAEERDKSSDFLPQRGQAAVAYLVVAAFRNDEGALPILATVEHHKDAAGVDPAERLSRVVRTPRQPHPQHVHRRPEIDDIEAGSFAYGRVAAVGCNDQIGADLEFSVLGRRSQAGHTPALDDEFSNLGLHPELKTVIALGLLGEEIKEVPLRHKGDEPAMRRQMPEIRDLQKLVPDLGAEGLYLLMGTPQEFV